MSLLVVLVSFYVISLILLLKIKHFLDFEISFDGKEVSERELKIWTYTPILNSVLLLGIINQYNK